MRGVTAAVPGRPADRSVGTVVRRSRDFLWYGALGLSGARGRDLAAAYAFARLADDAADESADAAEARARLAALEGELDRCFAGAPSPAFVPLARAIRARGLPRADFASLLAGLRSDVGRAEIETWADLLSYCALAANPGGRIALRTYDALVQANEALSDRICTGLALANFWRDVGPDLDRGRIYLPREDRERFGVSRASLHSRRADDAFRALLAFEVGRTRALLDEGAPLARRVRRGLAWRVGALVAGARGILDRIEAAGFDVFARRPRVTRTWKARVAAAAWLRAAFGRP